MRVRRTNGFPPVTQQLGSIDKNCTRGSLDVGSHLWAAFFLNVHQESARVVCEFVSSSPSWKTESVNLGVRLGGDRLGGVRKRTQPPRGRGHARWELEGLSWAGPLGEQVQLTPFPAGLILASVVP